ncbi:glycerate kinase [Staphylococcus xylosus]|uniref:Glycerate kinase n=1 Tax=Staphylococcus xylosus TaxID=1288 RepID=A0A939NDM7_STAXY|nr:glycerate kinase [Staphylococcus xylosus]
MHSSNRCSTTNDAGAGMLQALGARLINKNLNDITLVVLH